MANCPIIHIKLCTCGPGLFSQMKCFLMRSTAKKRKKKKKIGHLRHAAGIGGNSIDPLISAKRFGPDQCQGNQIVTRSLPGEILLSGDILQTRQDQAEHCTSIRVKAAGCFFAHTNVLRRKKTGSFPPFLCWFLQGCQPFSGESG